MSNARTDNRVASGTFDGGIDGNGSFGALTLTWDIGGPIIGFGADFSGVGFLDVSIDGGTTFFDINSEIAGSSGFFGLVDTMTPFTQVVFSVRNSTGSDFFRADNLIFAAAPPAVPLPAGAWLMLGGLGALRRARRKAG